MSESTPLINPNEADLEQLTLLPGVGDELAERIIELRPYASMEDMLRVPGLGAASLERMRSMLTLETSEHVQVTDDDPSQSERADELEPDEVGEAEDAKAAPITRSQVLGISAAAAGVGVIVAILLVLSIFIGINRTLNYSRQAAIRDVIVNVGQIETQLEDIDSALEAVDTRLEALEGLSGRMTQLENELSDLDNEVETASAQVQQMQMRMQEISLQIDQLAQQSEDQATFFERLQELLDEVFGSPAEENAG